MGSFLLFAGLFAGLPVAYLVYSHRWRKEHDGRLVRAEQELAVLRRQLTGLERDRVATDAPAPHPARAPGPVTDHAPRAAPAPAPAPAPGRAAAAPRASPARAASPPRAPVTLPSWLRWFTEGNALVRTGVVVLFFGIAFLLKLVSERITFPIGWRLATAAGVGVALVALGLRLRRTRPGYGLSLQGGGIGVVYLAIYAAFRLYALIEPVTAFGFMLAVVVAAGVLATRQDSMALAILGTLGGFLAPLLASTGQGNVQLLLAYYVVLNIGVLGLAFVKSWRPLNLLGFAFTFVFPLAALRPAYRPGRFWETEPFLLAFFAIYVSIAILYARHRSLALKHYVDGTIVFGTPLAAFALQALLVQGLDHALAWSASALALTYTALWAWLRRDRVRPSMDLLAQAFLALGIGFATLAVPLEFDARPTSALWAAEGAAAAWLAVRQRRVLPLWFGVALQALAGMALLAEPAGAEARWPMLNSTFLSYVILAGSAVFTGWQVRRAEPATLGPPPPLGDALFLVGLGWWLAGCVLEIDAFVPATQRITAVLGLATLTSALALATPGGRTWRAKLWPGIALVPALWLLALVQLAMHGHPSRPATAFVAWLVAIAFVAWFLHRHERDDVTVRAVAPWLHTTATWLVVLLATVEAGWRAWHALPGVPTWPWSAVATVPALALLALTRASRSDGWPFGVHGRTHTRMTAPALIGWLCLLVVASIACDAGAPPLPYLPVLNPLDLAVLLAGVAAVAWYRNARRRDWLDELPPSLGAVAAAGFGFYWANAVLLRTVHHWARVPYEPRALLESQLVQTSFTVFWTSIAVAAMLWATRREWRAVWLAGGGLLAVVVLKLFFFDLSQLSGLGRVVAFLAVGVMLLALGYFSPVPPTRTEVRAAA